MSGSIIFPFFAEVGMDQGAACDRRHFVDGGHDLSAAVVRCTWTLSASRVRFTICSIASPGTSCTKCARSITRAASVLEFVHANYLGTSKHERYSEAAHDFVMLLFILGNA
jgi:hypothetical protein